MRAGPMSAIDPKRTFARRARRADKAKHLLKEGSVYLGGGSADRGALLLAGLRHTAATVSALSLDQPHQGEAHFSRLRVILPAEPRRSDWSVWRKRTGPPVPSNQLHLNLSGVPWRGCQSRSCRRLRIRNEWPRN